MKEDMKKTLVVRLLQVYAPALTSQVALTAATGCAFKILSFPPYSPDMTPCDFYMFKKLKAHLRCTQYGSSSCVIEAVNEYCGDQ